MSTYYFVYYAWLLMQIAGICAGFLLMIYGAIIVTKGKLRIAPSRVLTGVAAQLLGFLFQFIGLVLIGYMFVIDEARWVARRFLPTVGDPAAARIAPE